MAESDRGIHPDLVEEVEAEREAAAAPEGAQNAAGRSRRRVTPTRSNGATRSTGASPPGAPAGTDEGGASDDVSPDSGEEELDWRTAETEEEALRRLTKKLPSEVLQKDETLSGLIGSRADLRARDIIRQQQRDAIEQAKRDAAASNDLYTLGELAQRDYVQQNQQAQQDDQLMPLMDVISRFQQTLPKTVQDEVGGKTYGEGKSWSEGAVEYMAQLVESATKHRLAERESALRKSILSEINGTEPVPEREGGTPSRVRVVTDEQIAAMTLAEYEGLFDENGRPRPGVQHRSTRGIPIQRQ